jgi:DNA-directed RNA polymerase specialized sigma24 family protein
MHDHPDASSNALSEEARPIEGSSADARPINTAAYGKLIEQHREAMHQATKRITGGERRTVGRTGLSAEDGVQEACLEPLEQQHNSRSKHFGQPLEDYVTGGYLVTAAKNKTRKLLGKWTQESIEELPDQANSAAAEELDAVEQAQFDRWVLDQVPGHWACLDAGSRQVIEAMLNLQLARQKDIAQQLDRSPGWVSGTIKRLGQQLYICIALNRCPRKYDRG